MSVSAGDAHLIPVYGYQFRLVLPIFKNDGTLITSGTISGNVSTNCGTQASSTNTPTQIASSSGMFYLDLTGSENSGNVISGNIQSTASGAVPTPFVIYPRQYGNIRTGTAQAGAGSSITLDSGASAVDGYYIGCLVGTTNNSPSGVQSQLRAITAYNGSTKVATVEAAWGTNPSSATTFEILVPNMQLGDAIRGFGSPTAIPNVATGASGAIPTVGTGTGQIGLSSGHVSNVDTLATYTGNTPQTGDCFAQFTNIYTARIDLTTLSSGPTDEYSVIWFKNGIAQTSGITAAQIQVVKRSDGSDLVAATNMTQVASTGIYKYDEATNRITRGSPCFAVCTATIDGSTRRWVVPVTRDA